MIVLLKLLTSKVGTIAMGVAAGAALIAGVYIYGVQTGRDAERSASLERSVEILRDRNLVDEKTGSLDDTDLCIALGGLPDECAAF